MEDGDAVETKDVQETLTESNVHANAHVRVEDPAELVDAVPPKLGRYTILRRIGRGAVGEVYEAVPPEAGAPSVALKAIRGMSPDSLYRFKKEFRTLANVQHRNVIGLHELVLEGDRLFFSMELIRGDTFIQSLCGPPLQGSRTTHPPASDFSRVREAVLQLAQGVQAIHRAGFLHRDLKPSNVLIEDSGRVVILDFGLVRDIEVDDAELALTDDGAVLGTPLFMSPEQASGDKLGPPSDWYTVGEMLYQALTGRPPFGGKGLLALLASKKEENPTPVREHNANVPEDLDALCTALLQRDPSERPNGEEVLRRLGAAPPADMSKEDTSRAFLGRREELARMREAFAATRRGSPVVLLIEGVSGIGKSALVEEFLRGLPAANALLLRGKCSERESIPYKALDSVMDMLSNYLRGISSPAEVQALLPRNIGAIARLFPVLLSVPAVALAPMRVELNMMPQEARRRGIEALREMMGRIADRRPLVVHIDDLQWSDVDSLLVLEAMLRDVDAPPLLLVCSFRTGAPLRVPALGQFLADIDEVQVQSVRLGPMGTEDAMGLALRLFGGTDRSLRALAENVAREAEGSPFFVAELVRHTQRRMRDPVSDTDSAVSLDDVIRHRISSLPPTARQMLSVIAVAGGRVAIGIATRIAAVEASSHNVLATLRAESLVRTHGTTDLDTVEIYHDRIRETVLRQLSSHNSAELHLAIGRELAESSQADAAALSHHFRQAGEDRLASIHTIAAADQAAEALAFERAAELYAAALELDVVPDSELTLLERRYADALASAGQQYEAAKIYLRVAERLPEEQRTPLLRDAAELLLTSGHTVEGRSALERTLAAFSMRLPPTRKRAIAAVIWSRIRLAARGLKFKVQPPESVDEPTRQMLDACWTATRGLLYSDGILSADFHARHLRLALNSGDAVRLTRALGFEAFFTASMAGEAKRVRCFEMADQAARLAEQADSDYARGMATQARGLLHTMLGDWNEAKDRLDEASTIFREQTIGTAPEIGYCECHAALTLQFSGGIRELRGRARELVHASSKRAHPYALGFALGLRAYLPLLGEDKLDEAQEQMERYRDEAPERFQAHIQNFTYVSTSLLHYRGDVKGAWALMEERRGEIEGFDMLRAPFPKAEHCLWVATNALAMAVHDKDNAAYLAIAKKMGRTMLGMDSAYRRAYGSLTLASMHRLLGDDDASVGHLRRALEGFDAHAMQMHAAIARLRLAHLVGGDEGDELRAHAWAYVEREEIVAPDKLLEVVSPGIREAIG